MNIETALSNYNRVEEDRSSQNLFARANARYILFGVNEPRENFPQTLENNLDLGSNSLAFYYLSIGCTLFENRAQTDTIRLSLEKGAEFLEFNHLPAINRNHISPYYILICALAYYAAGQYSKAFIVLKDIEDFDTDLATLTSAFLRKRFDEVGTVLNKILINADGYSESYEVEDKEMSLSVILFARSIASLMDYLFSGNEESLAKTINIQNDLLELLAIEAEPSLWWVVRLFRILTIGYNTSSLWATIFALVPDDILNLRERYIHNLLFAAKPITELFAAQISAFPKILLSDGAVISLPTSSGKTQIASLSILDTFVKDPSAKVLYLAPYRSLAYEVEVALKSVFEPLDFEVSQLYGAGQYSKVDQLLLEDASILIATPEKSKVILRGNEDMFSAIKLVIIDEGHLLGEQRRNVINEFFIEEVRLLIERNGGKLILLSAVLPNADVIAKWLCNDETACVEGKERLARQRLGLMFFRNNAVNLEWFGDEKSFNNGFIKPIPSTRKGGVTKPDTKHLAVALTALKLSDEARSLLLFTARARSIYPYAKAVMEALKITNGLIAFDWNNSPEWEELQLVCAEYDSDENKQVLEYARYGVLCHKGDLDRELKLVLEKLMRNGKPRIIIATTTLGQGVNLGVSTVIMADTGYYDQIKKEQKELTNAEAWNVIGRAGRAFQDIEGKVLFAVETADDRRNAEAYINNQPKDATSGILLQIKRIKNLAKSCKVDFDELVGLIAENKFERFDGWTLKGTKTKVSAEFQDIFDWLDDTLVSLDLQFRDEEENLDDYFRKTLAYLQAENQIGISQENVIDFLLARTKALKNILVPDEADRRSLAASGLPFASALALNNIFPDIIELGELYLETDQELDDKLELIKNLEDIISEFPSSPFHPLTKSDGSAKYTPEQYDSIRETWIGGKSLALLNNIKDSPRTCSNYYGYTITWVLGAISNKCKNEDNIDLAEIFEELAICSEMGLPSLLTTKIYLAGIRSRTAVMEISGTSIFEDLDPAIKISQVRELIIENEEMIVNEIDGDLTLSWLATLLKEHQKYKQKRKPKMDSIKLKKEYESDVLLVKAIDNETIYLVSPDYEEKAKLIRPPDHSLWSVVNRFDGYFYKRNDGRWHYKYKR